MATVVNVKVGGVAPTCDPARERVYRDTARSVRRVASRHAPIRDYAYDNDSTWVRSLSITRRKYQHSGDKRTGPREIVAFALGASPLPGTDLRYSVSRKSSTFTLVVWEKTSPLDNDTESSASPGPRTGAAAATDGAKDGGEKRERTLYRAAASALLS